MRESGGRAGRFILFGYFEEHRPKWQQLLKMAIVLVAILFLSGSLGRTWGDGVLVLALLGTTYIHLRWLPKHGVNGWTGEPKSRYCELVGYKKTEAADVFEENKHLVRRLYTEVVGTGDYSNLETYVSPDYVDHNAQEEGG